MLGKTCWFNGILGWVRSDAASLREVLLPFYSAPMRSHLEKHVQLQDMDILERFQQRTTKVIQRLEHHWYEDRMKELGLLAQRKQASGELLNIPEGRVQRQWS